MKHKHHDVIVAWAADTSKVVQVRHAGGGWEWRDCVTLSWDADCEYRIKPEPQPDVTFDVLCEQAQAYPDLRWPEHWEMANLRLTFDGETGKLKHAGVLYP